jgi:hypothetical protein
MLRSFEKRSPTCQYKIANLLSALVSVNCQLMGGADEGQAGFILVFAKAVLLLR